MTHHHHHCHEHGHNECSCCGHSEHEHCPSCGECIEHHHHEHKHQDFSKELLELADQAWMDVLKEKIKARVESLSGKNLDELASIVAEANHERWKHKMETQKGCSTFREKVTAFFNRK